MFSSGIFGIVNCEMLLCSVEYVLLKRKLESTRHLHNFQNNSKFATLNPLGFRILGMWICEILLCALEPVLFEGT